MQCSVLAGAVVQGKLEAALVRLTKQPRQALLVQAAGRTDAGVHARGQVRVSVCAWLAGGPTLKAGPWICGRIVLYQAS